MINIIILLLISFCLSKWFYHTVVVLAIWWQVLENFYMPSYPFIGICSIIILIILLIKIRNREIQWNNYPFKKTMLFLFLCYFLSGIIAHAKIGEYLNILAIFIIPIVSYFAICKIKHFWKFLFVNLFIWGVVILTVGFIELKLGFNPIIPWLQSVNVGDYSAEQSEDYIRFGMYRCQSLLVWCSTYGITCGFTAVLLLLLIFYQRQKNALVIYIYSFLLLFATFTCGTRSVYVAVAIALLSFILQSAFKFKYIVTVLVICICVYYQYEDFFDEVLLSFIDTRSVGGSSTELRNSQLDVALRVFAQSPFVGNGYGTCELLTRKSIGLYGAESFLFWVLIDRGILGVVGTACLFVSVLSYVRKRNIILCLFPIGLMVGKFMSLFPDIEETYYFFYLFIILRAYSEYRNENNKNNNMPARL